MPIVTVASQKGGAGKTTLATNIADALALDGERVLLIDADPQRSALAWGNTSSEPRVPVIGAGAPLFAPMQFKPLTSAYAWVIIDCPPRLGDVTAAAIAVADLILVPIRPTPLDLGALPATLRAIDGHLARGVIAQRPARSVTADSAPEVIRSAGLPLLDTSLGFRADYADAYGYGVGAVALDGRSKAAAEVRAILAEVRAILTPVPGPQPEAEGMAKKRRGQR